MPAPTLDLTPVRPAARADAPCTLDLLVTVRPPAEVATRPRPRLNLGLVLDRSGSMAAARKIDFARQACIEAVRALAPGDAVSLVAFDDVVETPWPHGKAGESADLLNLIGGIEPRNSTNLHGGWQEGGRQVASGKLAAGLNRVLLLSDGLANVGVTEPDAICTDVHKLATGGVGTSTVGLGDEYNEDLLEAMARSGDGNYYYVESADRLPGLFAAELAGLSATVARGVSLGFEPAPGVTVADRLNDFDQTPDGRLVLPPVLIGRPIEVVFRLNLPAAAERVPVGRLTLAWTPTDGSPQTTAAELALPAVSGASWHGLAPVVAVQSRAAALLVSRYKRAATRASQAGDSKTARHWLHEARRALAEAPPTPELARETDALNRAERLILAGEDEKFRKRAKADAYATSSSRPLY
jgi:Ca-activated chloride channel family protein